MSVAAKPRFNWLSVRKPFLSPWFKFGLLFVLFSLISWQRLDFDFGWHLQAGNYIRAHGIPTHDVFSYTASNFPWIDHEWANDVIVSLLFSLGGYVLLAMVYGLLWALATWLVKPRARLLTLMLAATALLPYSGIRPLAWTVLFLAILLRLIQLPTKPKFIATALLMIIWANLHGGFIIAFAVIGYYLIKYRQSDQALLLLVAIMATFINPYGPGLYKEIFRTIFDPNLHNQVIEWRHLFIPNNSLPFVIVWALGLIIFYAKQIKKWLSLEVFLFASALLATRNLPLFVIASVPSVDNYFKKIDKYLRPKFAWVYPLVAATFTVGVLASVSISALRKPAGDGREAFYPKTAVRYLKAHSCPGHVFNTYDYGGYLIWKLPSQKVFIDGRMPIWQDAPHHYYIDTYLDILKNDSTRKAQFSKYGIKCAIVADWPQNQLLLRGLIRDHWVVRSSANRAVLLTAP